MYVSSPFVKSHLYFFLPLGLLVFLKVFWFRAPQWTKDFEFFIFGLFLTTLHRPIVPCIKSFVQVVGRRAFFFGKKHPLSIKVISCQCKKDDYQRVMKTMNASGKTHLMQKKIKLKRLFHHTGMVTKALFSGYFVYEDRHFRWRIIMGLSVIITIPWMLS